ncbi:MAG: cob(I)yrinic acid a,c-diamide adenosyltransferase [Elusimicrobiota bacterium]|nr:cob(I)yrinic acid a,c-diamide adenosyltransferase [Elusimicrobiota bacterium]
MTTDNKKLHIYTGQGKGKTTAAAGQILRASASGLHVLFVYFNKVSPEKGGEDKLLQKLDNAEVKFFAQKHPSFFPETSPENMTAQTLEGLEFVRNYLKKNKTDMVILDEILISVKDGFIQEEKLIEFLDSYLKNSEVILTGRGATPALIEKADMVSEIVNVKHYYDKGQRTRAGIER